MNNQVFRFRIEKMMYNYGFESNELESLSIEFQCDIVEDNGGASHFSGTVTLPIEEANQYMPTEMGKAVMKHINDKAQQEAPAQGTTPIEET